MPKSFSFTVQRVSVVENNEGRIVAFMIDGIASQGKRMEAVRVEMDHASWLKVSTAMSKKGSDHDG